jgi:hypothetical protein
MRTKNPPGLKARRHRQRAAAAIAIVMTLALSSGARAGQRNEPAPNTQTPVADPGWPRTYPMPTGNRVVIYQPQIASWVDQTRLVAYVAVAHHTTRSSEPVLGTLKVEAETNVALQERLVNFKSLKITEAHFGSLARERTRTIVADVEHALSDFDRVIALDRVLAGLDRSQILPRNVHGVKAAPPVIFVSTRSAVLVNFDGPPIWSPIAGTDLKYAVNTNWDLFEHGPSRALFLRNGHMWLKAGAIAGPWTPAGMLPDSFGRLPADDNWTAVKAALPARRIAASDMPAVFVSTSPAELIVLRGAPSYILVANDSRLLWVNNTDSDVFRLEKAGPVYYLVAGRWFSAPSFEGPWTFATPNLPPEFQRISVEHPRARVLASVPGTAQAAEAVVLAQIPQTARVNKKSLQAPQVDYAGEPRFEPIDPTSLLRAVNTDKDIIKVGERYYLCFQGVWFVAANARGPWAVATSVPPAIYSIPVSSPSYHVTYVTIVEDADDWVVVSAGAGYTGVTIAWGCAVWGTGWYYPPYVWYGAPYPVYYPFSPTYGYAAWYNPWTAAYQYGGVAYGPYGGIGAAARYNPSTGTYARGATAWGPYGAAGAAQAYNPRTGTYAQTQQRAGVYGSWGSGYVQRGDDWAQTTRGTNHITGNTARVTRTDDGAMVSRSGPNGSGFVAAGEEGIYAGRDGSVYRRADGGGWQKYENGDWGPTKHPNEAAAGTIRERASSGPPPDRSTFDHLERDRSARLEGTERSREHGRVGGQGRTNAGSPQRRGGGPPRRGGRGR